MFLMPDNKWARLLALNTFQSAIRYQGEIKT
jgi:hypothetical protein